MYSRIIYGSSNQSIARCLAQSIPLPTVKSRLGKFGDGESRVKIEDDLEGHSVLMVQSLSSNNSIIESMLIIDACKRAGAAKIACVFPYLGYARQDRPFKNEPLSAKLIAELMSPEGVREVVVVDIHNPESLNFFKVPTRNVYPYTIFANALIGQDHPAINVLPPNALSQNTASTEALKADGLKNTCIVAPDNGGIARAQRLHDALKPDNDLVVINKKRTAPGESHVESVVGEVVGRDCIIVDDILDGGGTLCNAANVLKENGANKVTACITHGLFSGSAVARVEASNLSALWVTNSIDKGPECVPTGKIKVVSLAPLIVDTITALNERAVGV